MPVFSTRCGSFAPLLLASTLITSTAFGRDHGDKDLKAIDGDTAESADSGDSSN
jgi:hypothetical protein